MSRAPRCVRMLHSTLVMRAVLMCLAAVALTACDDLRGLAGGRNDASLVSASGGEVALADGGSLEFAITSEQYKRWERARRGINRRVAARFGEILQPDAPTERSIDAAVAYLESEPGARRSIESAGMSVRGFVVMTVALEQEMRLASGQPAVRPREPQPMPYDFPDVDTTIIPPAQPVYPQPYPVYPPAYPAPVDTYRVEPGFPVVPRDTFRVAIPVPRRDTIRRPSPTIFRRDTVRRDTSVVPRPPVIPDTIRPDTSRGAAIPPDSIRGA